MKHLIIALLMGLFLASCSPDDTMKVQLVNSGLTLVARDCRDIVASKGDTVLLFHGVSGMWYVRNDTTGVKAVVK